MKHPHTSHQKYTSSYNNWKPNYGIKIPGNCIKKPSSVRKGFRMNEFAFGWHDKPSQAKGYAIHYKSLYEGQSLLVSFLRGLFFDTEDISNMSLRNVGPSPTHKTVLFMRMFTSTNESLHKSKMLSGCVAGQPTSSLLVLQHIIINLRVLGTSVTNVNITTLW